MQAKLDGIANCDKARAARAWLARRGSVRSLELDALKSIYRQVLARLLLPA